MQTEGMLMGKSLAEWRDIENKWSMIEPILRTPHGQKLYLQAQLDIKKAQLFALQEEVKALTSQIEELGL